MPARRKRRTRAEQKQETRSALIEAGLMTFSRDGYHGASLEEIADTAGFSKGAVYSNFGGKSELFLAVLDYNLSTLRGEQWDPLAPAENAGGALPPQIAGDRIQAERLVRGFELATLEFITTAARDEALVPALRTRIQTLLDAYERVAGSHRAPDEEIAADGVAQLMAALEQGVSVLALSGAASIDGSLLRAGMRRLLRAPADPADRPDHTSLLPTVAQVQRLIHDGSAEAEPPE
ncbi:AcrR family transcriptional regulator [Nocardiopsis mwathae]|uniref:AcrR family transcriptional regulator n=1 Tax=Nocardiopsis mwathae TaxID=1472723 RepID=A0A7W9YFV0_9ACTN|nr:TetR/AcrR family transcriptional regulator [Nocardiopsis mwathae]MBB6170501.1 AcrR family transcriptional regulator [Nocardiopsis mwathae]